MLVRDYVVFVFGVERLVVRWDIDLVIWELVLAEVFEEVCVPETVEVHVGVVGVFGLY
jgi:hypothetical protein